MRGKKAKAARRVICGKEYSPQHREYARARAGQIVSDERRRRYQALKALSVA